jgi:hypothetical protein
MASREPSFAPIEQLVEADTPLQPSVDLYALAGVARYWISGQLPVPAFARRETLADTVQRLRLTWPRLHYSASLLDALDSALSIYPAERPQSVAQMRARLDIAAPATPGPVIPESTAAPGLNDAVTSSAPAPQPAPPERVAQDFDAVMAFAFDPEPLATSGVARIDDDPPVRTAFARQEPKPRRIAMWSGAVLVLLALMLVGVYEFGEERQVARVLAVLGISRATDAEDKAAVSASAVGPAAPVTPPIAVDAEAARPMPTEPTAADSPASATAPASTDTAPIAADAGAANPMPTESTAADSPARATAPASLPSPNRPTRVTQQRAPRVPVNPREECGARTQFSLYRCMQLQCSQRQWASHAQCERFRATDSVD